MIFLFYFIEQVQSKQILVFTITLQMLLLLQTGTSFESLLIFWPISIVNCEIFIIPGGNYDNFSGMNFSRLEFM